MTSSAYAITKDTKISYMTICVDFQIILILVLHMIL